MTTASTPVRLALAAGDPNGIGPEIALKALRACAGRADVALTLYGPRTPLEGTARQLGLQAELAGVSWVQTDDMPAGAWQPGRVAAEAGEATVAAGAAAIRACREGAHDAVIACPHHETAIHAAGIPFSGYPSLLARVCEVPEDDVFLMLVGGGLRIVHVTLHQSLRSALDAIDTRRIVAATRAAVRACARLGVPRPRIGVFGINPHASEGGLFGSEDEAIAVPAVERLRAEGLDVDGPAGADMLLARRAHDVYVAMWHDQGHIPIKLLAPNAASALSIGAGVLLSSVGHGSAMDIAGRGVADPGALLRTIDLFAGMAAPAQPEANP